MMPWSKIALVMFLAQCSDAVCCDKIEISIYATSTNFLIISEPLILIAKFNHDQNIALELLPKFIVVTDPITGISGVGVVLSAEPLDSRDTDSVLIQEWSSSLSAASNPWFWSNP